MEIKNTISMAEFGAIVNTVVSKCYESGSYDPTYREFWTQYAIMSIMCDYPFEGKDIEEVWNDFQTDPDTIETWKKILRQATSFEMFAGIRTAVDRSINYKNSIGAYSMTDMALTNLIDAISAKIDNMDELFTAENMQSLVDMSGKLSKLNNVSQKKIVSAIIDSFNQRNIKKASE